MLKEKRKNASLIGPLILIALGVIFLLTNVGVLGWGLWTFFARVWPLLFIGLGIDILLGGKSRAVVVGALLIIGVALFSLSGIPAQATASTETISQGLEGAKRAEIHLAPGVAKLHVRPGDEASVLVSGTVRTGRGERLEQQFSTSGDVATYTLESRRDGAALPWFDGNRGREWMLELNPTVPTALTLDAGVGEVELNLERFNLSDLQINSGVGEMTLTLPAQGQFSVDIDSGVGSTTVRIPSGMAARIQASRGIGAVNVEGNFERQGDLYISPDFESAANHIDLRVDGGVGETSIQTF